MNKSNSPIISAITLREIHTNPELVILDARYGNAFEIYQNNHLQGALFVDLDKDISEVKENPANGGRHPLPSISQFKSALDKWGISSQTHVVVYDDDGGAFAARLWWMLRSIGHENVQVLDGGFSYAVKSGFPTKSGIETSSVKANYSIKSWNWPTVEIGIVESKLKNKEATVIDVRSNPRYRGELEPIDVIAGHIPGAINTPFVENLNDNGCFKSKEELTLKYQNIRKKDQHDIIVHCGSGVTACHTILAMEIAGMKTPKLYVGSWSEWSRSNKPIGIDLLRNANQSYFIQESERLTYRKVTMDDLESWSEFFVDNDRLHFLGIDTTKSKEILAKEWVDKQSERYDTEGLGLLAVIEKESNQLIGTCGLLSRVINNKHELEIGYSFKPEFWGKGYATEAANQMRIFGFKNKMASRFISIIHKDNLGSMKVAIRNKMTPLFNYSFLGMDVIIHGTTK